MTAHPFSNHYPYRLAENFGVYRLEWCYSMPPILAGYVHTGNHIFLRIKNMSWVRELNIVGHSIYSEKINLYFKKSIFYGLVFFHLDPKPNATELLHSICIIVQQLIMLSWCHLPYPPLYCYQF